jgi:CBS-domain-containing membrane protein
MKIQVREFMSAPVCVATDDANVAYAREMMEKYNVGAIPVMELGVGGSARLAGIVTRTDLCGVEDERTPLTEVMSAEVATVNKTAGAIRAATLMMERGVHHLVVVDDAGKVVGMLSALDFVRMVSEQKIRNLASVIFV